MGLKRGAAEAADRHRLNRCLRCRARAGPQLPQTQYGVNPKPLFANIFVDICQPPAIASTTADVSATKSPALPKWHFEDAICNKAVSRHERFGAEVHFRIELIVNRSTQARITRVRCTRFLIEQRVARIEHEAASETSIDFKLHCVCTPAAGVAKGQEEITEVWKRAPCNIRG